MIRAMQCLGFNQFQTAKWFPDNTKHYKFIRVETVSENERRWSTVLQNIITWADSTLLRTAYKYPFEPRQHLYYRNKWWEIINVGEITLDVAPQSLALVKGGNMQYVLEVIEVDGYDA